MGLYAEISHVESNSIRFRNSSVCFYEIISHETALDWRNEKDEGSNLNNLDEHQYVIIVSLANSKVMSYIVV